MSEDEERLTGGFLRGTRGAGEVQVRVDRTQLSKPDHSLLPAPAPRGRKTKLAALGLNPSIIREGDPRYAAVLYQCNKYRKTRMKELARLHGHVSAGAGALLASASLALAASRFLYERFAGKPEDGGGDTTTLKQAAQLADSARQSELAAWELSAREGVLKRRQEAMETGMPWLVNVEGVEKAKLGRKTNAQRYEKAILETPVEHPVIDSLPEADNE